MALSPSNVRRAWNWYVTHVRDNDHWLFDVQVPVATQNEWIADAIRRPGALRAKATAADALTSRGTINVAWLRRMALTGDPLTRRQARLALTLRKINTARRVSGH